MKPVCVFFSLLLSQWSAPVALEEKWKAARHGIILFKNKLR